MDYSGCTRNELLSFIRDQKSALLQLKSSTSRPDEALILEIKADLEIMLSTLKSTTLNDTPKADNNDYNLMIRLQAIHDSVKDIKKFNPGNDVNRFITDVNKTYMIHVKPEIGTHPSIEKEFVRICKQLLNEGIFQQMTDSQHDTSTFEQLKAYLITTHGSQMTNFQHLSRAWDLQRRDGERLTDFAGRLENTIREAAVHIKAKFKSDHSREIPADTVFSLMGAMLMSEKVKAWTPSLYPHIVKTMDKHYTAGGIASDVQRYIDCGVKTDDEINDSPIAYYANRPQRSDQRTRRTEHNVNRQTLRPQARKDTTTPRNTKPTGTRGHFQTCRDDEQNQDAEICQNYMKGYACFHGRNCRYRHPPRAQAYIATDDKDMPPEDTLPTTMAEDFQYGPGEM